MLATDALLIVALPFVGVLAGFVNVMAGGGSLLTLPLMVLLGLDGSLANGTNRVAILAQNSVAIVAFRQRGASAFSLSGRLALCAAPGAVLGAWTGTRLSGVWFNRVLALLMLFLLVLLVVKELRQRLSVWRDSATSSRKRPGALRDSDQGAAIDSFRQQAVVAVGEGLAAAQEPPPSGETRQATFPLLSTATHPRLGYLMMVAVGFYGGFIQAGVGLLIMALLEFSFGHDLVRANVHKVFVVACFTVLALAVFAWRGQVNWAFGGLLAVGNSAGAYIASRLSLKKGETVVRPLLWIALLVLSVRLLLG